MTLTADDGSSGRGARCHRVPAIEVSTSRTAEVGGSQVRRALPQRNRRTVGAWCFADHMGPVSADDDNPIGIGPHPHMGLHTVTWLVEGELLHRDSLGSEQTIRAGQLNLMTAGGGVSHAEEPTKHYRAAMHGIQLWVAQPEATRHGGAAFEHHAELPEVDLATGTATVLIGELEGTVSPARTDTELVGVDLRLRKGTATIPLRPRFEHALVVLEGAVEVGGQSVDPGHLAYLGLGGDELTMVTTEEARLLVLGGTPFESPIVMWWNFVGRSRQEMTDATADWNARGQRFGETGSSMARIAAPRPPWRDPVE
jgi:redox-sensitive bicupin YhaK (pirin superfamily)